MNHYETTRVTCPACGEDLNCAGAVADGRAPQPGDLSICVYCRMLLTFGAAGEVRLLTADEMASLTPEERQELEAMQAYITDHPEAFDDHP